MNDIFTLPPLEEEEHLAFMQWVKYNPEVRDLIIHIPNEGKRSVHYAQKLKRMGMRKGVSDFFLPLPTTKHHGLWIELKRFKGSRETPEQKEWIQRMRSMKYKAEFAYGCDHAKQILIDYLQESKDSKDSKESAEINI
jgi:hypothetical protein